MATYFTTEQVVQEDPDLVDDFQAAIEESLTYADENPDEIRRIILTYTQVSPRRREPHRAAVLPPGDQLWTRCTTVAELMQRVRASPRRWPTSTR